MSLASWPSGFPSFSALVKLVFVPDHFGDGVYGPDVPILRFTRLLRRLARAALLSVFRYATTSSTGPFREALCFASSSSFPESHPGRLSDGKFLNERAE